jgi:hypothetical protein
VAWWKIALTVLGVAVLTILAAGMAVLTVYLLSLLVLSG